MTSKCWKVSSETFDGAQLVREARAAGLHLVEFTHDESSLLLASAQMIERLRRAKLFDPIVWVENVARFNPEFEKLGFIPAVTEQGTLTAESYAWEESYAAYYCGAISCRSYAEGLVQALLLRRPATVQVKGWA